MNTIKIQKIKQEINRFAIFSKHSFFDCKELTFKIDKGCLLIRKPILSDVRRFKVGHYANGWRSLSFNSNGLKIGIFDIDLDDSTEDELVIYLD